MRWCRWSRSRSTYLSPVSVGGGFGALPSGVEVTWADVPDREKMVLYAPYAVGDVVEVSRYASTKKYDVRRVRITSCDPVKVSDSPKAILDALGSPRCPCERCSLIDSVCPADETTARDDWNARHPDHNYASAHAWLVKWETAGGGE